MGKVIELQPIHCPKVWGYEDWLASTHPDGCQKDFMAAAGDYPLIVKIIQADSALSLQVHPDDEKARLLEGENERGKTECWYVLEASSDASIIYGLKDSYTEEELRLAIQNKSLEEKLNRVSVKKGDFVFIPAGTVHAICGGLRLLEVQQNCNITYRLYDWGRPRELHIEKGLNSIKNLQLKPVSAMEDTFDCSYFSLKKISVKGGYTFLTDRQKHGDKGKWQLLFVSEGNGLIHATDPSGQKFSPLSFEKEKIFALAPGEKITIEGKCEIIRIILP